VEVPPFLAIGAARQRPLSAEAWYRRRTMDAKRKLKGMLARIFSDASAEESERAELKAYLSSGELTVAEIKQVFDDFVQTTWKITIADGVVSDVERERLREIVQVLGLERDVLPVEWAKILG
jgi:tellurite resistance protein